MRASFLTLSACLVLVASAVPSAQAQQADPLRLPQQRRSDLPRPQRSAGNPCAQFGPGFVRAEGSDTCVKIGGSVGISAGVGGSTMPGR